MNKPDDVSQEAWERACAATDSPFPTDIEAIARAIDAAVAAESGRLAMSIAQYTDAFLTLHDAIRNRGASK